MSLASRVGRAIAADVTVSARKTAVRGAADRADRVLGDLLIATPIAGLVKLGKTASKQAQPVATEMAFVSAGRGAQGVWLRKPHELMATLRVAEIAHATPHSGEAAVRILTGARDRFGDFASRTLVTDAAYKLGQKPLHLAMVKDLAHYSPGAGPHVHMAEVIATYAAHDRAYAPLITHSLHRANDRTVTFAEARVTQAAARALGEFGPSREAAAIASRLHALGLLGPGNHRAAVQQVLREVRSGSWGQLKAMLKDYGLIANRALVQVLGLKAAKEAS